MVYYIFKSEDVFYICGQDNFLVGFVFSTNEGVARPFSK